MISINKINILVLVFAGAGMFFSCSKDKTPVTESVALTKWEIIPGHYKVYDTLGNFLYEMDLIHKTGFNSFGLPEDSLTFSNFDGEFTFTSAQWTPPPVNYPMAINIGMYDTLYDTNNKRWKLGGGVSNDDNNFHNDTIRLRFQKTNINYWIYDLEPYYACDCKQIAVKQH